MMTFVAVAGLFMVMFGFFGFALWFSKWKQEGRACCSTGVEELLQNEWDPCFSCPRKDSDECDHDHRDGEVCENHPNVNSCDLESPKKRKTAPAMN